VRASIFNSANVTSGMQRYRIKFIFTLVLNQISLVALFENPDAETLFKLLTFNIFLGIFIENLIPNNFFPEMHNK
jgi:hypothetical protein